MTWLSKNCSQSKQRLVIHQTTRIYGTVDVLPHGCSRTFELASNRLKTTNAVISVISNGRTITSEHIDLH
jgi:hypothetical protein